MDSKTKAMLEGFQQSLMQSLSNMNFMTDTSLTMQQKASVMSFASQAFLDTLSQYIPVLDARSTHCVASVG